MTEGAPTPYSDLNTVLADFVDKLDSVFRSDLVGVYLQGSFAVGDFDSNSDVDFIVIIQKEITEKQLTELQEVHKKIFRQSSYWARHMEGSYFPQKIIKDKKHCGEKVWYLDNGSDTLVLSNHCNTILVRWTLRKKGVILKGSPPKALVNPITTDELQKDIFTTLTDWGATILANPKPWANQFYQCFIVLNYCRMLHDLKTGENNSKRAGAEWAKKNLDSTWKDLIDKSWSGRVQPEKTVQQPANSEDFSRTLDFLEYVIKESHKFYKAKA